MPILARHFVSIREASGPVKDPAVRHPGQIVAELEDRYFLSSRLGLSHLLFLLREKKWGPSGTMRLRKEKRKRCETAPTGGMSSSSSLGVLFRSAKCDESYHNIND